MKEKILLIFSLLVICNRLSFSATDTKEEGLIFFTNFNYFKSNERNFKSVKETDKIEINIDEITISTKKPEIPSQPIEKYTDIFITPKLD